MDLVYQSFIWENRMFEIIFKGVQVKSPSEVEFYTFSLPLPKKTGNRLLYC